MLQNTGKLAGYTIFITGASRGIGKAIALKAAKDGANIVIAAKTAQAHPKLPGTIYTAAQEIEANGGKALPCIVDVRDEQQISNAVENAVKTFGGIDILVNNASAINLTGTLDTPMKKVDLMMSINSRGTYLTSKLCIPYLKKSKNGHILNLSPPLNMNPIWFKNHCAYTMAKYGMSMCVLGMAEEFKGEIAVNALWPKTAVQTAAMVMLGGSEVGNQCRNPEIMADAAYAIFSKPKTFTGNFVIDEEILKQEGIKDFDVYAVSPGHPLLPDFFLDEEPEALVKKMQNFGGVPAFGGGKAQTATAADKGPVAETFRILEKAVNADVVKGTQGVYQFELSGEHPGTWYIDLKNANGSLGHGAPPGKADVSMIMTSEDFVKMFAGKLKPTMAFMSGKLKIKGDMTLAIKLEKLMSQLKSRL
ncbi:hydroxysteroid dehydrogenase-like protein 2 [Callorhinchus milii]|uniref:Hydroxysteroid dehydrogenase-like protein 2 n=1 Tax=Callorhinchus milii TaxID=7868 RepID=K4FYI9_CALMI|nr:hydroxysteroid dehydrogenase-like protein 2 [Callorhinchus milii]AFK11357.1 hydroxysteroid dehydrogenase-like protein 2-like isoform 1 [Callorhinchus milii]|eukprot:gi/632976259/ref/XP_007904697.1/ PREDICTED: hydroxysteroid dehydrogenase-like protein 2 isoform X2 [Callorhinchus milii]